MNTNYIDQIKSIIDKTGWSQVELAGRLGVTFAALNRWINSKAVPHPKKQVLIYNLYKEKVGILPISKKTLKKSLLSIDKTRKKYNHIKNIINKNKNLREDFLLELTYNSNAIEGNTLTKKETEVIIFDKAHIHNKSYIEHLEATNHATALELIFNGKFTYPVVEKTILDLHQIILQGISPDAGKYSKHKRAIRGVDLKLPDPKDIQEEMNSLLKIIDRPKQHIIEHIASVHASFEAIHPFGDGNGRVGRLIIIIQLLHHDYPPCIIENNQKADYYEVLEFAQKKSDTHFSKFLIDSINKGYQLIKKHS